MKETVLRTVVLLLIAALLAVFAVIFVVDCGREARQLVPTADDSIVYSPNRPAGVIPPEDVRKFIASLTESFEAHNLDAIMEHFSDGFLHQGMSKQQFHGHIGKSYLAKHLHAMDITLLQYEPDGDVVYVAGFIDTDLGVVPQSSGLLPLSEGSQLRLEQGEWKLFGNREKSPFGAFHDFLTISASLAPQDLTLYRKLLPDTFAMPDTPLVSVSITENQRVSSPLSPYRLGQIKLLGTYRGEEGWYVLTLPETVWMPVLMGQTIGYPKYVTDSTRILLEQTQNGWKGRVTDKDQHILSLAFTADASVETLLESLTRPSCLTLARQLLPGYTQKPVFLLLPDKSREDVDRERQVVKATVSSFILPSLTETYGRVRISVDQDAPWAKLFPEQTVVKGAVMQFSGDWNLKHQVLNDEQENF